MKRSIAVLVVAAAVVVGWTAQPQRASAGEVRGKVVRLTEQKVGEREYIGVVIQPVEGEGEVVLLTSREGERAGAVRGLSAGQMVEASYGEEGGHKWIRGIRVIGPEVSGKVVRVTEQRVGEREHIAIVVRPAEGEGEVTILVPRDTPWAAVAKQLREGQAVRIAYGEEAGHKWVRRIQTPGTRGEVVGKFVGLREKQAGEREYVAVVVRPRDSDEEVELLMPRRGEQLEQARRLAPGQTVTLVYDVEAGHKWVRRIQAARGEGAELREMVRKLQERLARLEKQIAELRAENARLRKQLAEPSEEAD